MAFTAGFSDSNHFRHQFRIARGYPWALLQPLWFEQHHHTEQHDGGSADEF